MKKLKATIARNKRISILMICFILLSMESNAQYDQMFTQYMNNEMFINPAYTGTRDGMAVTLASRNQWVGFDGAPKTQSFTLHSPVMKDWGAGFSALNEKIGVTRQMRFSGTYSYKVKFNRVENLSFGLSGGIVSLNENYNSLTLKDPNDLAFPLNTTSVIAPTAGFGMYYYSKYYFIGLSIPRMIKNSIISDGTSAKVKNSAAPKTWHYYLTAAYVKKINQDFKWKPSIMIKQVYGAPMQVEISNQGIVRDFWWIGFAYRTGDALSAITGFNITPQLRVFYSYDYALTKVRGYNSGSHEITIGYDFARQKRAITSPRLF